jgi:hypothetical protein
VEIPTNNHANLRLKTLCQNPQAVGEVQTGSKSNLPETQPLQLVIRGLGHVPSFKNQKSIMRNHATGKPFIGTKPERKEWMQKAIQSIESQLRSAFLTMPTGTLTALSLPSWIASSLPLDDSRQWIPEMEIKVELVEPGKEGAVIQIERLQKSS